MLAGYQEPPSTVERFLRGRYDQFSGVIGAYKIRQCVVSSVAKDKSEDDVYSVNINLHVLFIDSTKIVSTT